MELLTSQSGRQTRNITRRRSPLSVRRTEWRWISGASFSTILMHSFQRSAVMLIQRELFSRVTFLSESAVQALMHGFIRNSSIWIHRLEHHLMHLLRMVRTGASLHTTGKRWQRMTMHGGRHVLERCRNISMHSVLTISSDSSAYGRFLSGQRAALTAISVLHCLILQRNSRILVSV